MGAEDVRYEGTHQGDRGRRVRASKHTFDAKMPKLRVLQLSDRCAPAVPRAPPDLLELRSFHRSRLRRLGNERLGNEPPSTSTRASFPKRHSAQALATAARADVA